MIAFFRNNLLLTSLMMLPYAILFRVKSFMSIEEKVDFKGGLLFEFLQSQLSSSFLLEALALILIFIQAWILNQIVNRNRIDRIQNSLAGVFYILLMSCLTVFHGFHPIVLANLFLLLGIQQIFKIYKKPLSAIFIFNTGIFFGLAAMSFNPYILLLILGLLGILILNSIDIKRIFQFLFGFAVVYYLAYVIYLNLGLSEVFIEGLPKVAFSIPFPLPTPIYFYLGPVLLMILIALFSYGSYMIKQSIQSQQKIDMFYWLMLFSFIGMLFYQDIQIYHLSILALPLSFLLHMNVLKVKNTFLVEFFHFILLLGILGYQFSLHLLY